MELYEQFRALRKRQKISQETLSEKTGIHRSTIVRFEKGGGIKYGTFLKLVIGIGANLIIDL
jgi:DNA-binding XRE family transcriptional regulator